jgi:hypothetical protein
MRTALALCLALVTLGASACCSPPPPPPPSPPPGPPELLAPEEFNWTSQKISFKLPPAGWRREGDGGGGVKGVRWVKEKSVGEAVGIGEYYIVADRNRAPQLREILANLHTFEFGSFAWSKAIRTGWAHTDSPFTSQESEISAAINDSVSRADTAFRARDREATRAHLEAALAQAERLHFSLADVLDRVEFKPERRQEPEKYKLTGRRETFIGDHQAVVVDYTVTVPERARTYAAREAYVVYNSHLFICTFIGLPETVEVFDLVVASIAFQK